jgi:hypothetical protein
MSIPSARARAPIATHEHIFRTIVWAMLAGACHASGWSFHAIHAAVSRLRRRREVLLQA